MKINWFPPDTRGMKQKIIVVLSQLVLLVMMGPYTAVATPLVPPAQLSSSAGWRWPVLGKPQVLVSFDKPAENWLPGHRGVDLAAEAGSKVVAPHRGQVKFRGVVVDRPVLVLDHGNGFLTSLEPVTSTLTVGSWVEAGAELGAVDRGSHCSERCLHWGVRLNGDYIDPALLIQDLRPSILLPLT